MVTPFQVVSSLLHLVTQWMSVWISVSGRLRNSCQFHSAKRLTVVAGQGEGPFFQRDALRRTGGEYREATLQVLAGRNGAGRRFPTTPEKSSGYHGGTTPQRLTPNWFSMVQKAG